MAQTFQALNPTNSSSVKSSDISNTLNSTNPTDILSPNSTLCTHRHAHGYAFCHKCLRISAQTLCIWKSVGDIDFAALPNSFVLKTNHDCGGVVLVPNKAAFLGDKTAFETAMTKLTNHLNTNYYIATKEWHYGNITPRVFAEELLGAQGQKNA